MAQKYTDYIKSVWDDKDKGTLLSHCQELAEFFLPRRSTITAKRTEGDKRHERVFRNIGEDNLRTWATGMMNGTFPVNQMFHSNRFLGVDLDDTPEDGRQWLEYVTKQQYWAIQNSNFAYVAYSAFLDEGCFGTSCFFMDESYVPSRVIYFRPFSIEQYTIVEDMEGTPDGCVVKDCYTPVQLAEKFGIDALPNDVRRKAEKNDTKTKVNIFFGVTRNYDYDPSKVLKRGMAKPGDRPYKYVYFMEDGDHVLGEGGYYEFPFIITRMNKNYGEMYGRSPAMSALHAYKILTKMSEADIMAYERHARPGYLLDSNAIIGPANPSPGINTIFDSSKSSNPVQPWPVAENPNVGQQAEEIYRREVEQAFMRDVFLTLNAEDIAKAGITATQLSIAKSERLAQLGPHLKVNEREKIRPIMNRLFGIMWRNGMLPEPPESVRGAQFEAWPTSPVFSAVESAAELEAIDREMQYCMTVESRFPGIWDRFNFDAAFDVYATAGAGTASKTIVPLDQAQKVRQERAERQAQERAMMMQMEASEN